mmetsp:Transcript_28762/g.63006  ORF Transcript_28762/g.63006 Transcript_28762/m.63006 type:complete len:229 (+) Transcript_28762:628-1314(+)
MSSTASFPFSTNGLACSFWKRVKACVPAAFSLNHPQRFSQAVSLAFCTMMAVSSDGVQSSPLSLASFSLRASSSSTSFLRASAFSSSSSVSVIWARRYSSLYASTIQANPPLTLPKGEASLTSPPSGDSFFSLVSPAANEEAPAPACFVNSLVVSLAFFANSLVVAFAAFTYSDSPAVPTVDLTPSAALLVASAAFFAPSPATSPALDAACRNIPKPSAAFCRRAAAF